MSRGSALGCVALSSCLFVAACDDTSGSGGASASTSTGKATSSGTSTASGSNATTSTQSGSTGSGTMSGSAGCGSPTTDATGAYLPKTIDVGGATRDWFVYLPPGYDPTRAYPVVYQFHGCSSSPNKENNNVPIEDHSGGDAIIVRGRAVQDCWDNSPSGPDVAFFDAMVAKVEATYCADPTRRFAAGYSSGSFMTHALACVRGDKLRGVASIAGGQTGQSCKGKLAALLIHDADDGTVNISASVGARDQYLSANGCAATTQPFDPSPCVQYDGCAAGLPVVWCQTSGKGHDRQDGLAGPAFWNFLSKL